MLTGSAVSISTVSILFLLVDFLGFGFLDFTLQHHMRTYSIRAMCTILSSHTYRLCVSIPCFHQQCGISSPLPSWQLPRLYMWWTQIPSSFLSLDLVEAQYSQSTREENAFYARIFIPVCIFEEISWSIKKLPLQRPRRTPQWLLSQFLG